MIKQINERIKEMKHEKKNTKLTLSGKMITIDLSEDAPLNNGKDSKMNTREETRVKLELRIDYLNEIANRERVIDYNKQIIKEKIDKINGNIELWTLSDIEDKINKYFVSIFNCVNEIQKLKSELKLIDS